MEHKDGINTLKDFFLSSAFRGEMISFTDLDAGLDLFRDLEIAGSNFDSSVKMSSSDLMSIWEGFSLYDLPESWKWMRLDQVGSIVGGGTPDTANKSYWANGDGTPWITPADMRNQSMFIFGGKRNLTDIGLRESSSKLLPSHSVVFSSRAPIGYVGITGVPLATNQGFKSCVPFIPEMAKFIYFYLIFIGEEINKRATGTTFKEVSGKQFAATPIPVPPLRTQQNIVKMIEEFLSVSEELDRKILHQKQLAHLARKSAIDAISTAQTTEELLIAWERIQSNWEVFVDSHEAIALMRKLVLNLGLAGELIDKLESFDFSEMVALGSDKKQMIMTDVHKVRNSRGDQFFTAIISSITEVIPQSLSKIKSSAIQEMGQYPVVDQGKAFVSGFVDGIEPVKIHGKPVIIFGDHTRNIKYVDFDFVVGADGVKILRPYFLNPKYLYYMAQGIDIKSRGYGRHFREFCNSRIPIISIADQEETVRIIEGVFTICEQLEKEIFQRELLAEKFAKSVVSNSA